MGEIADGPGTRVPSRTRTRSLGEYGEDYAVEVLRSWGWRIVERNWRSRFGEIDVIATDEWGGLVIVEVKTRRYRGRGGFGEESVTPVKVRRLRRLACQWLEESGRGYPGVRIDVIAIDIGPDRSVLSLCHFEAVGE